MGLDLLESVDSPEKLKKLDLREMEQLAAEIRKYLIDSVSKTGGHLSSNLGVVELTLAIHHSFASPVDRVLFDVGHQCYTHKLLTGRKNRFPELRQAGGISGFPCPDESEHDIVKAGHASAAMSAAIGIARAKKLKKELGYVIVIVGDGAFTGGMNYEAINNVGGLNNLIIILNDNTMSISKNVGGFAHYFTRLRTSPSYYKAKSEVKQVLSHTPVIGRGLSQGIQSAKSLLKRSIYKSTFFEEMGFMYVGPLDGHDLPDLCQVLGNVKNQEKPVFIHVETKKGKGYTPAERNPGAFHGVSAFNAHKVKDPDISPKDSFSTVFGQELTKEGESNPKICAITAAMKYGTGLQYFKKAHFERFFDVGMAESHAVTFAAGLAREGMLPVVAIYSTFLQRSYDQIIHDVMLSGLDVVFAIDRAGLVPDDGDTHQGIYDAAYLSQQSQVTIVSPANYAELRHWLLRLLRDYSGPRAIRYPRGTEDPLLADKPCTGAPFDVVHTAKDAKGAFVSYGGETAEVMQAAGLLEQTPVDCYQMVIINPIPPALVEQLASYEVILFAEEGIRRGGIGEHLLAELNAAGFKGRFCHVAVPETGMDHAGVAALRRQAGLDAQNLADTMQGMLEAL